jgi:hypothetical protein
MHQSKRDINTKVKPQQPVLFKAGQLFPEDENLFEATVSSSSFPIVKMVFTVFYSNSR